MKKSTRIHAIILLGIIVFNTLFPLSAYALTSGPSQPEFSSFEPVATNNMVNEFTGDFTYNLPLLEIPGPEGSGYPLSLSYHSGTSPEEEASWVGYGWTLNPGAINRSKRGYADDSNGSQVKIHNKVPANWTASVGGDLGGIELFGWDAIDLGVNASLRYNNYKGFGYVGGVSFGVKGVGSLGYSLTDNMGSFSYQINPGQLFNKKEDDSKLIAKTKNFVNKSLSSGTIGKMTGFGSSYGLISRNWTPRATNVNSYKGNSFNVSASFEGTPTGFPAGSQFGLLGSFTRQDPFAITSDTTYGYLYSHNAGLNDVMDYVNEKLSPFNKRDMFLSIPFSSTDDFTLQGEGLSGSFRARAKRSGHFRPNPKISITPIVNMGLEIQAGGNLGPGGDAGEGLHTLSVLPWTAATHSFGTEQNIDADDEPYVFRFNNDLGGDFLADANDASEVATLSGGYPSPGSLNQFSSYTPYNNIQKQGRTGRSSYIGHNTNDKTESLAYYTKDKKILDYVNRSNITDGIGEFTTTNEDGMIYTFGLPVFSKNEKSLQFAFNGNQTVDQNYLMYANLANHTSKIGQEMDEPYTTTYLLTSIFTPDYIDRTMNGPSDDDLGGYTKFIYERRFGDDDKKAGSENWYHWRIPYNGLLYQTNEISNKKDDFAGYTSGDKEIYYLDTIETKTHYAVFYTSEREDGKDAASDDYAASINTAAGSKKLLKLDSINLFVKSNAQNPIPIQTVHFEYDYSLMHGLPNSSSDVDFGKLTLKKVWTSYGGVYPATISPYKFVYAYHDFPYPSPYDVRLSTDNFGHDQNPNYDKFSLDPWGSYRNDGDTRHTSLQPWLDQTMTNFDPAAWQLKQIHLPSGGQIHVQYEQKEYQYVHNRRAQAMVSLKANQLANSNKYYLNTAVLGLQTPDELTYQAEIIRKEIIDKDERMFFKFLYSLIDNASPDIGNCQSEFIEGYVKVTNVGVDADGLYIDIENSNHSIPYHVCKDYVRAERGGNIPPFGSCDPSTNGMDVSAGPEEVVMQLLGFIGSNITANALNCNDINEDHSYFRIPLLKPKKGGGIRVKRLLMYDESLPNEKVLFGHEYLYETHDPITNQITSSGVATNEPATIREECALTVNMQKRTDQGWLEKAIAGRDMDDFEGPIGETLLPGASIGYSKVIRKNIHEGRTNPGFTVNEYYTCYDYPFDKRYPFLGNDKAFSNTEIKELDKEWVNIPGGLFNYSKSNLWLAQGYRFVLTDFHGKPKKSATYSGSYQFIHDPDHVILTSSESYEYFQPGEKIPISQSVDMDDIDYVNPGKETEVVFEGRVTEDINNDINVEGDGNIGIFGFFFFPFLTGVPSASYNESKLFTHVTTKIVSYPSITKKVTSFQDGVFSTMENLAFSPENCRPVLTRTYDGFKGLNLEQSLNHHGTYLSHAFNAQKEYSALGQKAFNERRKFVGVAFNAGTNEITLSPSQVANFIEGDLILMKSGIDEKLFNVISINSNILNLIPHSKTENQTINSGNVNIEIIRSGKANRLNEDAGKIVVYGEKIDVDYITVLNINFTAREDYADALNVAIQTSGMGSTTVISTEDLIFNYNSDDNCCPNPERGCRSCNNTTLNTFNTYSFSNQLVSTTVEIKCGEDIICCFKVPRSKIKENLDNDHFTIDAVTGSLLYWLGDSPYLPMNINTCQFCDDFIQKPVIKGVIDAYATTYDGRRELHPMWTGLFEYDEGNPYENSTGKWKPDKNYVYKENIRSGVNNLYQTNDNTNRIYNDAGVYDQFMVFDWQNEANNDEEKWIKVSQVNYHTTNGQAIEEQDIRGIKSSAKYGYHDNIPYLIGQNAAYGNSSFESFEIDYDDSGSSALVEDNHVLNQDTVIIISDAHAGKKCAELKLLPTQRSPYPYASYYKSSAIMVTPEVKRQGLLVKFWVKTRSGNPSQSFEKILVEAVNTLSFGYFANKIARTGDWTLYECELPADLFVPNAPGSYVYPKIHFLNVIPSVTYPSIQNEIWIDDFRVQPKESKVTCHVYDPATLRVVTTFDDQHFGMYYQYNAEGKLVRKIIETERGMKTVKETQYNSPKIQRNGFTN